ncbi:MAG: zinc ribbon domain-containing protein [Clostridia bacterium]|nr:zinc ribbon domain-containing protein [Clostridia bacterium]
MINCEKCGKENSDSAQFCAACGKALKDTPIRLDLDELDIPAAARKAHIVKISAKKSAAAPQSAPEEAQPETPAEETPAETPLIDLSTGEAKIAEETPAPAAVAPAEAAAEAVPMRVIDWIVVFILTAIPVVDVIMLLIWAISSKTKPSKKSFAKATLIFGAILIVLSVAAYFIYAKFLSTDPVTSWNQFM